MPQRDEHKGDEEGESLASQKSESLEDIPVQCVCGVYVWSGWCGWMDGVECVWMDGVGGVECVCVDGWSGWGLTVQSICWY